MHYYSFQFIHDPIIVKPIIMAMLSIHDHDRSRMAGSTHEILGLCSLLVRVVGYKVYENLNLRLGKETKVR
jgi:hypothetical protein